MSVLGQCLDVLEADEPPEGENVDPRMQEA